jgi:hypothetical protein
VFKFIKGFCKDMHSAPPRGLPYDLQAPVGDNGYGYGGVSIKWETTFEQFYECCEGPNCGWNGQAGGTIAMGIILARKIIELEKGLQKLEKQVNDTDARMNRMQSHMEEFAKIIGNNQMLTTTETVIKTRRKRRKANAAKTPVQE